ncbi:hypothetical protein CTheo_9034 [Ceratobasidium theobromae]|uniref:Uncharacterized protein n=1 Tax=Ceratobasidium theobromae TaxID=1582974 RepID=A0A5N5Q808_9AGAM|nr:hypothetical protein CTheo_9034 [Ceratobasidium theobromae]
MPISAPSRPSKSTLVSKQQCAQKAPEYTVLKAKNAVNIVSNSRHGKNEDSSGESDNENNHETTTGDNQDDPAELHPYLSNSGNSAYVPDEKGVYVRWSVSPKPKGRAINLKADMELDGCKKDQQLFLAIREHIRILTNAAIDDTSVTWPNLSTEIKANISRTARNKYGYLLRFKGNWATEEIMKRALCNRHEKISRIEKAGGVEEWRENVKTKRKVCELVTSQMS